MSPPRTGWFNGFYIHIILYSFIFRTGPDFSPEKSAGTPEPRTAALRERPASNCVAVGGRREVRLVPGLSIFISGLQFLNLLIFSQSHYRFF